MNRTHQTYLLTDCDVPLAGVTFDPAAADAQSVLMFTGEPDAVSGIANHVTAEFALTDPDEEKAEVLFAEDKRVYVYMRLVHGDATETKIVLDAVVKDIAQGGPFDISHTSSTSPSVQTHFSLAPSVLFVVDGATGTYTSRNSLYGLQQLTKMVIDRVVVRPIGDSTEMVPVLDPSPAKFLPTPIPYTPAYRRQVQTEVIDITRASVNNLAPLAYLAFVEISNDIATATITARGEPTIQKVMTPYVASRVEAELNKANDNVLLGVVSEDRQMLFTCHLIPENAV
jgi:hypothetical protein